MKKKYLFALLAVVSVFLVIPPLLVSVQSEPKAFTVGFGTLFQLFMALALEFFFIYQNGKPQIHTKEAVNGLMWGTLTLGLLMVSYGLFTAISFLLPSIFTQGTEITVPDSTSTWLAAFISLLTAAFYEEVLYRQFLPETILSLLSEDLTQKKTFVISIEAAVVLVFAVSHHYLGLGAVLNAFLCGSILRMARKHCASIIPTTVSHFIYNFLVVIFMFFIG